MVSIILERKLDNFTRNLEAALQTDPLVNPWLVVYTAKKLQEDHVALHKIIVETSADAELSKLKRMLMLVKASQGQYQRALNVLGEKLQETKTKEEVLEMLNLIIHEIY